MKTKTLFFALLVAVSTTAFGFSSDEPALTVVSSKGSEVFKVIYKGSTTARVKLNLLDERGNVIHSEVISGLNGFIRPLNFKGLESGQYTIEVVDKADRFQESVTYLPAHELKSIHVSKLLKHDGKFLLAVANAQEEAIHIKIFDQEQRLVHAESKTLRGDLPRCTKCRAAMAAIPSRFLMPPATRSFLTFNNS